MKYGNNFVVLSTVSSVLAFCLFKIPCISTSLLSQVDFPNVLRFISVVDYSFSFFFLRFILFEKESVHMHAQVWGGAEGENLKQTPC